MDRAFGAPGSDAAAVLVFSRADGRPLDRGDLVAAGRVVAVLARFEARQRAAAPVQSPEPPAAVRVTPVVRSPNHLIAVAQFSFSAQSGTPAAGQAVVNIRAGISRADGRPLDRGDLVAAGREVAVLASFEARQRAAAPVQSPEPPAAVRSTPVVPSLNHLIAVAQFSFSAQAGTPATGQAVVNIRAGIGRALAGTGLRAELTGQAAAEQDNVPAQQLAMYGMLAAIVVLLLVLFRSPGLPFLIIGAIFGVGQGVLSLLDIAGHVLGFQLDQVTTTLLQVVLLGVGTDYAVFLLYRYRDRLRAGEHHRAAMAAAIAKVGHAIAASALAVAVSFTALLASGLTTFRILGPSLAVAVLAMLATSVTLLPAVLAIGAKRRARSRRWTRPRRARATGAAAGLVARRPGPWTRPRSSSPPTARRPPRRSWPASPPTWPTCPA